METQAATWDEASNSLIKVKTLKQFFSKHKDEFDLCATNISEWEKHIKELQTKIQKAK